MDASTKRPNRCARRHGGNSSRSRCPARNTVSDFGIPKVIGGNFNVLALDIFKQVIGQQNFNKGAVVSLILLVPVFVAFVVDWIMQGRLQSQFSSRAVPYAPRPKRWFDAAMLAFCVVVALLLLAVLG